MYLLKNKSEVAAKFAEFVALAETETGKRVKVLQSDNGGEYTSDKMAKFCADRGILQKFTPPYTPQLNGVAEKMNRTLVEYARQARRNGKELLGRSSDDSDVSP